VTKIQVDPSAGKLIDPTFQITGNILIFTEEVSGLTTKNCIQTSQLLLSQSINITLPGSRPAACGTVVADLIKCASINEINFVFTRSGISLDNWL
jgi:hypothetical protein